MKFTKQHIRIAILLLILCFHTSIVEVYAQIGLPGDGDVDDVPEAPITDLILFLGIAGLILGYLITKKKA